MWFDKDCSYEWCVIQIHKVSEIQPPIQQSYNNHEFLGEHVKWKEKRAAMDEHLEQGDQAVTAQLVNVTLPASDSTHHSSSVLTYILVPLGSVIFIIIVIVMVSWWNIIHL